MEEFARVLKLRFYLNGCRCFKPLSVERVQRSLRNAPEILESFHGWRHRLVGVASVRILRVPNDKIVLLTVRV